jgi:hypothetical protein
MTVARTWLLIALGALLVAGPRTGSAHDGREPEGGTCEERCRALGRNVSERCLAAGVAADRCEALAT